MGAGAGAREAGVTFLQNYNYINAVIYCIYCRLSVMGSVAGELPHCGVRRNLENLRCRTENCWQTLENFPNTVTYFPTFISVRD